MGAQLPAGHKVRRGQYRLDKEASVKKSEKRSAVQIISSALAAAFLLCAGAFAQDVVYQQNYDGKTFSLSRQPSGAGVDAGRSTTTTNPAGVAPYSKPYLLRFTVANSTGYVRAFQSAIDTRGYSSLSVSFMMYRESAFPSANDTLTVQVSTTNASTFVDASAPIRRYAATAGWTEHVVDLSGYVGYSNLYVAFLAQGDNGNDIHIDNARITGVVTTPVVAASEGTAGSNITITGFHFGETPGSVTFTPGGVKPKPVSLKVTSWTPTEIVGVISKDSVGGLHDLRVLRKEPKGAPVILADGAFTFAAPEIASLSPDSGVPGDTIAIYGSYFGTKKPLVSLINDTFVAKCKVVSSSMDPDSGDGIIEFTVPANLPAATYDVRVENAEGPALSAGAFSR